MAPCPLLLMLEVAASSVLTCREFVGFRELHGDASGRSLSVGRWPVPLLRPSRNQLRASHGLRIRQHVIGDTRDSSGDAWATRHIKLLVLKRGKKARVALGRVLLLGLRVVRGGLRSGRVPLLSGGITTAAARDLLKGD